MTRQRLSRQCSVIVCVLVLLGLATLVSACASATSGSSPNVGGGSLVARYVGAVDNQPGLIGVVADQQKVLAYYCDDKTVGQWFEGPLSADGKFDVTNASGSRLQGTVIGDGVNGTLHLAQASLPGPAALAIPALGHLPLQDKFKTTPVTDNKQGIFRAQTTKQGSQYTGGWVVGKTIKVGLVQKAAQVIGATPFDPEKSPNVTTADGVVLTPELVDTVITV